MSAGTKSDAEKLHRVLLKALTDAMAKDPCAAVLSVARQFVRDQNIVAVASSMTPDDESADATAAALKDLENSDFPQFPQ